VLPLLVLAEVLIVLSNILLKASPLMMAIGVVTVALMTFGITSLGVGMGAIFPASGTRTWPRSPRVSAASPT